MKTWRAVPTWLKILLAIVYIPIILMVVAFCSRQEEISLRKVLEIAESDHKAKFEGYLHLYGIDDSNVEYKRNVALYGQRYLKTIPASEPGKNLAVYKLLAKVDKSTSYAQKITRYSHMLALETKIGIASQGMSRNLLSNKSTYQNSMWSDGKWINGTTYVYDHQFSGRNAFGVTQEYTARYITKVRFPSGDFTTSRVSIVAR
jgi:hypothetical protein